MPLARSESITPQQKARRWLPPQQRFVTALAGWQVQRRHLLLRRLTLTTALLLGLGAWWLGGDYLQTLLPGWAGWPVLAVSLAMLVGALWTSSEQIRLRTALMIAFFLAWGLSAGLLTGLMDTWRRALLAALAVAAPAGATLNLLFMRRQCRPEFELLLVGPWLAAAVALAYPWLFEPLPLSLAGAAGLLLCFAELLTAPASLALRAPREYVASAVDVPIFFVQALLGPLRGD